MPTEPTGVLRLADVDAAEVRRLLAHFGIELLQCSDANPIPGSYWGDDEAGLRKNRVYARNATPLHSVLHEACHFICADPARRERLDTDAGSDDAEESAVCYLQILLAGRLRCVGRERLFVDMDAWGYSFRLGSTRAWFEQDASDALAWLLDHGIVEPRQEPILRLRGAQSIPRRAV
jgi:hypothetical protein